MWHIVAELSRAWQIHTCYQYPEYFTLLPFKTPGISVFISGASLSFVHWYFCFHLCEPQTYTPFYSVLYPWSTHVCRLICISYVICDRVQYQTQGGGCWSTSVWLFPNDWLSRAHIFPLNFKLIHRIYTSHTYIR